MSTKTLSLTEALPAEMARVSDIMSQYEALRGMPLLNVEPAIFLMKNSLAIAAKATASADVVAMLGAYEDLKGFEA